MSDEIKDAFHIAKLCLFTTRLQNDIQNDESHDVKQLIIRRAELDQIRQPVSTRHQGLFLSFAYVCLVWLWELAKRELNDDDIVSNVEKRFSVAAKCKVSGPRTVRTTSDHLRLIRNAISHARVKATDAVFIFSDQSPKKETASTSLELSWENLVQLSEAVLFAVNDMVYPQQKAGETGSAPDRQA